MSEGSDDQGSGPEKQSSPQKNKEEKVEKRFYKRAKLVKEVLHIPEPPKETKPGLTLLAKPAEETKRLDTLPPVYATIHEFERYQEFLDEDSSDSKLPTLPSLKK